MIAEKAHNFNDSLAFSHTQANSPIWEKCYRQWFPGFQRMLYHPKDGWGQRRGIDRSVYVRHGDCEKEILVDEKMRRPGKNGRIYTDIALEFWSNKERRTPGWVCKPLMCDYIAYGIPSGVCWLLPVLPLQEVFRRNRSKWLSDGHFIVDAPNEGYTTQSVAVKPEEIFKELGVCLTAFFNPAVAAA